MLTENEILTCDKLNLMATPVVELSVTDPVNDQNFFRNGNFYSSFWSTPAGMSHAPAVISSNANYWSIEPQGAAVVTKRSVLVPDTKSLFSNEIDGANSVTTVWFGQNISGDLSATLRRNCTFSGYIYNFTGLTLSPKLGIDTANAFNNFTTTTQVAFVDLQTCATSVWTYVSATVDMSTYTNITNGIIVYIFFPSGTLSAAGKSVNLSRLKFQIGEIATEFTDDVGLFITTPSIDSTMLQDGCIARPAACSYRMSFPKAHIKPSRSTTAILRMADQRSDHGLRCGDYADGWIYAARQCRDDAVLWLYSAGRCGERFCGARFHDRVCRGPNGHDRGRGKLHGFVGDRRDSPSADQYRRGR